MPGPRHAQVSLEVTPYYYFNNSPYNKLKSHSGTPPQELDGVTQQNNDLDRSYHNWYAPA